MNAGKDNAHVVPAVSPLSICGKEEVQKEQKRGWGNCPPRKHVSLHCTRTHKHKFKKSGVLVPGQERERQKEIAAGAGAFNHRKRRKKKLNSKRRGAP